MTCTSRWPPVLALATCLLAAPGNSAPPAAGPAPPEAASSADALAPILAARVDARGLVDYAGLGGDRAALDAWVSSLARLEARVVASWTESEQIAFWINAYNGLTLRVIIDHYPISRRPLAGLLHPSNSIRQVKGAWDGIRFEVAGEPRTLDTIEHEILRRSFAEPRIHFALVCAARSCPPLRADPFRGDTLDAQLDDQARRFLASPERFRLDAAASRVHLSPIFDWFGEDFVRAAGGDVPARRAVLDVVARYLPEHAAALRSGRLSVSWLGYDWSLNEQPEHAP